MGDDSHDGTPDLSKNWKNFLIKIGNILIHIITRSAIDPSLTVASSWFRDNQQMVLQGFTGPPEEAVFGCLKEIWSPEEISDTLENFTPPVRMFFFYA